MSAAQMASAAYKTNMAPIRTDRSIELDAFSNVTHRLSKFADRRNFVAFVNALHDNRRLWTLIAADVADSSNGLPGELRARIFYLAEFTDRHTSRILAGDGDVAVLIDINTAIMRGLRQSGGVK